MPMGRTCVVSDYYISYSSVFDLFWFVLCHADLSGVWLLILDIDNTGVTMPPAYIFRIATMD